MIKKQRGHPGKSIDAARRPVVEFSLVQVQSHRAGKRIALLAQPSFLSAEPGLAEKLVTDGGDGFHGVLFEPRIGFAGDFRNGKLRQTLVRNHYESCKYQK